MGLILDSSVVIASERRGDTVEQLIERIVKVAGDQEAAPPLALLNSSTASIARRLRRYACAANPS
jgi:hypothetical protein